MRISLNGLELARRAENDQTVGQVLAELRSEIQAGGKIVTDVVLDGHALPDGWQRRQRLSAPVAAVRNLEITVQEPQLLKRQTLHDAASLAGRLVNQTKPLSRKFRLGDEVTANTELASFLDDLKLVLAGLDHSTRTADPAGRITPVRDRIIESANRLLPSLDRLYKAQAGGDYIAVADELEYDLCEQISGWEPLLTDAERTLDSLPQAQ
ncbi:MAG TPA: hypothetical protein VGL38_10120 [bacterium]